MPSDSMVILGLAVTNKTVERQALAPAVAMAANFKAVLATVQAAMLVVVEGAEVFLVAEVVLTAPALVVEVLVM